MMLKIGIAVVGFEGYPKQVMLSLGEEPGLRVSSEREPLAVAKSEEAGIPPPSI